MGKIFIRIFNLKLMKNNTQIFRDIKIVGLDMYGTVLPANYSKIILPRNGFSDLVAKCKNKKIIIVSASDSDTPSLKSDLNRAKIPHSIFDDFYSLETIPKDFLWIIEDYGIKPKELLVIGDSRQNDIQGSISAGANYFWVPKYTTDKNDSIFKKINF